MEFYTLDRGFRKQNDIDSFESAIWTERYYGDGDFKISVPASSDMLAKLPQGQLMMCVGSPAPEPMILETRDINEGILETTGITLTQWLNNRTIRTSSDHAVKEWLLPAYPPGIALKEIVQQMCISGDYLDGTIDTGIPAAQAELFKIPGLYTGATDASGDNVEISVPFGPVYDALKSIATTYEIGMQIVLEDALDDYYVLLFVNYRGADRTSDQSIYPVIRFSPEMDSFTGIKDLESITDYRNFVYMFAPGKPPEIIANAGFASSMPVPVAGFDLRVFQGFVDDLPEDLDSPTLVNILNQKAESELKNHKIVKLVDGQIVETEQLKYGRDFFMGDIVEVEGNTGVLQKARITEYIRSQDSAGERAYPTLSMID